MVKKIPTKKEVGSKKNYRQVRRFDQAQLSQYWRIFRVATTKLHIKILKSITCVARGVATKINLF